MPLFPHNPFANLEHVMASFWSYGVAFVILAVLVYFVAPYLKGGRA